MDSVTPTLLTHLTASSQQAGRHCHTIATKKQSCIDVMNSMCTHAIVWLILVPLNSLQRHLTTTRPTNPSRTMALTMFQIWISGTSNGWLQSVQDRFELVKGLNSTMDVCMQSWRFVLLEWMQFSSTTTPKRSPRTLIRPTVSTSIH